MDNLACRVGGIYDVSPLKIPQNPSDPLRGAHVYLAHTEGGASMRAISREIGVHPSTVMRQVRRIEERRDDPLYDEALCEMRPAPGSSCQQPNPKELSSMPQTNAVAQGDDDVQVRREARRILRRLSESKSFLAISSDAEKGVVFRETVPGRWRQTATVDRDVAREFALRDWITCKKKGKFASYVITPAGKSALERMLAEDVQARRRSMALSEVPTPFQAQHQEPTTRNVVDEGDGKSRTIHVNAAESPLAWLARRTTRNGDPFLNTRELNAGERMREDFERAAIGPRIAQNWERFMTAGVYGGQATGASGGGSEAARESLGRALKSLGPGLSDIAYRCCCFLEGLETAEKRLGWSKRSGKVVLKIALQRLADHYDVETA